MKNKSRLIKKMLFSLGTISLFSMPFLLTSCSNTFNELLKNSVLKNNKFELATDFTFRNAIKKALESSNGQKTLLNVVANDLVYQWYEKIAKNNTPFNSAIGERKKSIEKDAKNLIDSYKKDDKNNWKLLYQQRELDDNGGTEQAKYLTQLKNWTRSEFESKLFEKDYSAISKIENNIETIIVSPSEKEILDVLVNNVNSTQPSGSPTYKFVFSPKAISNNPSDLDKDLASFQQFIYDEWVQSENPYVVNMSLWKYGTPTDIGGIDKYYNMPKTQNNESKSLKETQDDSNNGDNNNGDGEGDGESTPQPTSSNYAFPYFSNNLDSNDGVSTISKFKNFLSYSSKNNNFKLEIKDSSGNNQNEKIGLKNIPKEFTEDSSTFILAKNGSIYNDLYTEFAAACSSLYLRINGTTTSGQSAPSLDATTLEKTISINTSAPSPSISNFDLITQQFLSTDTTNISGIPSIKLNEEYLKKIINKDGPLKNVISPNGLYVIDAFSIKNDTTTPSQYNLDEFMLLRNEAGVHAISLDGIQYIGHGLSSSSTLTDEQKNIERKKRAADIVFYHYLMNKNGYSNFEVDIKNEISTFFTNNADLLILKYAFSQYSNNAANPVFDIKKLFLPDKKNPPNEQEQLDDQDKIIGQSYIDLIQALVNYIYEDARKNREIDFITKMYNTKSNYSNNYGINAINNGLAARWIYGSNSNPQNNLNINNIYNYDVAKVSKYVSENKPNNGSNPTPTWKSEFESKLNDFNNKYISYISKDEKLKPLESKFDGFKYSQVVLSNDFYLNSVLNTYGSEGNALSDNIKLKALNNYLGANDWINGSFVKWENNEIKFNNLNNYSNVSAELLDNAYSNFYYINAFNSKQIKWLHYNDSLTTTPNDFITKFRKYIRQLWYMDFENNVSSTKELSLLTTLATTKYLLEHEQELFNYLKNKISYGNVGYLVWENSYNSNLTTITNLTYDNVEKFLSTKNGSSTPSDIMEKYQNLNNNMKSSYIGNLTSNSSNNVIEVALNNSNSFFSDNTNLYTVVSDMVGYKGLQTSSENSISSTINSYLFGDKKNVINPYLQGIFYGYGSEEQFQTFINQITTISELKQIIDTFKTQFSWLDLSYLDDNKYTLSQLKGKLNELFSKLISTKDNKYLQARDGYVSSTGQSNGKLINDSSSIYLKNGAYYIQFNYDDMSTFEKFKTRIESLNNSSNKINVNEIYCNLLVEASMSNYMQTKVLNIISNKYKNGLGSNDSPIKLESFDKRITSQLDSKWLINWKKV